MQPPHPLRPEGGTTPPFIQPYLRSLDRLQQRKTLRPEALNLRAQHLLDQQFGTAPLAAETAFAHGSTGLLASHTHYFPGFALLLTLPHGTSVALRPAAEAHSRIAFDGSERDWHFSPEAPLSGEAPVWIRLVVALLHQVAPAGTHVDVVVVSTVPAACIEAYLAALAIATLRAAQALFARPDDADARIRHAHEALATAADRPFSIAYPLAAEMGQPDQLMLVDAAKGEHLLLPLPPKKTVAWGLLSTQETALRPPLFHQQRQEMMQEAVSTLQRKRFPNLSSLRDLEHHDLQAALEALSRRYRPIVRHLVTENRRVHRFVHAFQRGDWQMVGTLLLISHTSVRDDWDLSMPEADFLMEAVQAQSLDGLYGGCLSGSGGAFILLGQPFAVPEALDRLEQTFAERFRTALSAALL